MPTEFDVAPPTVNSDRRSATLAGHDPDALADLQARLGAAGVVVNDPDLWPTVLAYVLEPGAYVPGGAAPCRICGDPVFREPNGSVAPTCKGCAEVRRREQNLAADIRRRPRGRSILSSDPRPWDVWGSSNGRPGRRS